MIEICLGIALVAFLPGLLPLWCLPAIVCISLILLLYFRSNKLILRVVFVLLAITYASSWGYWNLSHRLTWADSPQDVEVIGVVQWLPKGSAKATRFRLAVEKVMPEDALLIGGSVALRNLQLNWYRPAQMIAPGQRWRFSVRLKPPHGLGNPGGFDYTGWLFRQQVDAVGYVTDRRLPERLPDTSISLDRLRYTLLKQLDNSGLSAPSNATLHALLLGDKSALDDQQWRLLKSSGTVHLIVISGLHIGVACLAGYLLGMLMQFAVSKVWSGHNDLRLLRVVPALLIATAYAALAGFSIPTQRALIMALFFLVPPLFNLMPSLWQRWWLALVAVLLWQPLSIDQAGLWLSFSAVAALLLIQQIKVSNGRWTVIRQALLSQRAVFVVLLPLLVMFTGSFSAWAPLINLLAIPYVSFIVLPSALLLLALMPVFPGYSSLALDTLVQFFWQGLELFAGDQQALVAVAERPVWAVVVASIGGLLLILPRLLFFRLLGCFFLLPLIRPASTLPDINAFRAWVFDVGQGTSVMVQTRHHVLLYDTGAALRTGGSIAQYSVIPALQAFGVDRIDRLVVSHADNDHAGGYASIAAAFEVRSLESGSQKWRRLHNAKPCQSGESWSWDGVFFQYVNPQRPAVYSENNRSCVLQVRTVDCGLLLPGDVEAVIELQILDEYPGLGATWLVASHHGSRFSTHQRWLQRISPKEIIFSAGRGNPYGHPADAVLSRVKAQGSVWRSTAASGAVLLEAGDGECASSAYREQKKRYWSDG